MFQDAVIVWFGMTIASFFGQAFRGRKWAVALEQSIYQAIALTILVIVLKLVDPTLP